MRDYTKIEAWKLADDLTVAIYEKTRSFPREERFELTSQLRRAAFSVPANISEGSARESKRDYLHFLYISRGSLMETKYFIHLSRRLGYLQDDTHQALEQQAGQCFACLQGLIRAVERESGKLARMTATLSSFIVIGMARLTSGL
jgi:four helix bundle protein